jgi:alpha-galactosidase
LYANITEANILEHLDGATNIARREQLPMRVFQIDDGFTPEMGDWLEVRPQFPRGMKSLLDDIRAAGFVPGLWIAPFMVGNRSRLFRAHPDWVVRERATSAPLAQMKFYGEFRWHKRSEEYYILDTTHPDAFEYLRQVFRVWRNEWGCEYFKTDFMQFGSAHGASRALYHTQGMTRIEIWRRVAEMIRAEIGEALWLGCGCPLWASVGVVDAVRIGRDVGVAWRAEHASSAILRDGATRNFANGILWQADPDCILLRERFHELSDAEINSLALFGGLLGGVLMTSDAVDELSPARLNVWKFLLGTKIRACRFPLLGRLNDPVLVQTIQAENFIGVFFINTGGTRVTREYTWELLGVEPPRAVYAWTPRGMYQETNECAVVALAEHTSKLLLLGSAAAPR